MKQCFKECFKSVSECFKSVSRVFQSVSECFILKQLVIYTYYDPYLGRILTGRFGPAVLYVTNDNSTYKKSASYIRKKLSEGGLDKCVARLDERLLNEPEKPPQRFITRLKSIDELAYGHKMGLIRCGKVPGRKGVRKMPPRMP